MLQAEGHSFSNVAAKVVSVINLAWVAAIGTAVGARSIRCVFAPICTSRAGRPGTSSTCSGSEIAIGDARLKVTKRILRCAATNVDPDTGIRDLAIPETLMQTYDHADCGVYAQVIAGGEVAPGRRINP